MFFVICRWFGDIPGLVLYNGQYDSARGDYVCFGVRGGYPEFGFDVGSGPALIQGNKTLSLNQWNTIKLKRENSVGENLWLIWIFFFFWKMFSVLMHLYYIDVLNRIFLQCEFFCKFYSIFSKAENKIHCKKWRGLLWCFIHQFRSFKELNRKICDGNFFFFTQKAIIYIHKN